MLRYWVGVVLQVTFSREINTVYANAYEILKQFHDSIVFNKETIIGFLFVCFCRERGVVVMIVYNQCLSPRCEFESRSDEVCSMQHYVIKSVSDL